MARFYLPPLSPIAKAARGWPAPGVKPSIPVQVDKSAGLIDAMLGSYKLVSGATIDQAGAWTVETDGIEGAVLYKSLTPSGKEIRNRQWPTGSSARSFVFRIQNTGGTTQRCLLCYGASVNGQLFHIEIEPSNNLCTLRVYGGSHSFDNTNWPTGYFDIAVTFPSGKTVADAKFYVEGVELSTSGTPGTRLINTADQEYLLGESGQGTSGAYSFYGRYSSIQVFNRELPAAEIAALHLERWKYLKPANSSPFLIGTAAGGADAITASTETDSATILNASVSQLLGAATETDSAVSLSSVVSTPLVVSSEIDASFDLSSSLASSVIAATESDSAVVLTSGAATPITASTEIDSAETLTASVSALLVVATETDSCIALSTSISDALLSANEIDSATALLSSVSEAISVSAEIDSAIALLPATGALPLSVATETDVSANLAGKDTLQLAEESDSAVSLSAADILALAAASETDSALPLSASLTKALSLALEIDASLILSSGDFLDVANEIDSAVNLVATGTHTFVNGVKSVWNLSARSVVWKFNEDGLVEDYDGRNSQDAKFRGRDLG